MRTEFIAWLGALAVLPGCLVVVGDDSPGTESAAESSSETGDGDGDGPSGDGDGEPGDGDGDTSGDGDGDTSGDGDGDASGDGDGDGSCAPPEAELGLSYALAGLGPEFAIRDLDWSCTLEALTQSDTLALELDCPEAAEPVFIEITATPVLPPLALEPGAELRLRHVYDGPFWFNLHLRLDLEGGGHLLTLVDGDSLLPGAPYMFELPLPTTPVAGQCAWTESFCGELERYALSFELDGQGHEVLDGTHAILGPPPGTDIWVREAGRLHEISCTDTPPDWFRLLIVDSSNA